MPQCSPQCPKVRQNLRAQQRAETNTCKANCPSRCSRNVFEPNATSSRTKKRSKPSSGRASTCTPIDDVCRSARSEREESCSCSSTSFDDVFEEAKSGRSGKSSKSRKRPNSPLASSTRRGSKQFRDSKSSGRRSHSSSSCSISPDDDKQSSGRPIQRDTFEFQETRRIDNDQMVIRRSISASSIIDNSTGSGQRKNDSPCPSTCAFEVAKRRKMEFLAKKQREYDDYILNSGFGYFDDFCTCSFNCIVRHLYRDNFVRNTLKSLIFFAVGIKLCFELDGWTSSPQAI